MGVADVDGELMARVAKGDRQAFAALFDRHQARVTRFAVNFVGDRGRAEEAAQEIFLKLYRSANSYRPTARFKTFLFRVATNHCLNEVRRGEYRARPPASEEDDALDAVPDAGAGPEQVLFGRELEAVVAGAMAALSERERAAFTMCRFEGMAYREIALALQASEAAVKSLIHRATLSVARRIDEHGAEPPATRSEG